MLSRWKQKLHLLRRRVGRSFRMCVRTIASSFGRYMALLCITALGVSFFGGLKLTRQDMHETLRQYVASRHMYDLMIVGAQGISPEVVRQIRSDAQSGLLPFAQDIEAQKSMDMSVRMGDAERVIRLIEMPQKLNTPSLREGDTLPAYQDGAHETDSMAVWADGKLSERYGVHVSDTFYEAKGRHTDANNPEKDKRGAFEICGIVDSPLYIGPDRGVSELGAGVADGYFYVPAGALHLPADTAIYMACAGDDGTAYDEGSQRDMWRDKMERYIDEHLRERFPGINLSVLTREENPGYAKFVNDTSIVSEIADVFPIFFASIVILVCVTSMLRLVAEERGQVGVQKALGVPFYRVLGKYMAYSVSSVLFGWCVGTCLGAFALPQIFWKAYKTLYDFSGLVYDTDERLIAATLAVCIMIPVCSTVWICLREWRNEPAALLRPVPPAHGRRILLERCRFLWDRMPFLEKSVWRNLFRYKLRLSMMLAGIGGCTALLLTGLGLRDSMLPVTQKQYEQIRHYTLEAHMMPGIGEAEIAEAIASEDIADYMTVYEQRGSVTVEKKEERNDRIFALTNFFSGKKEAKQSADGIVIIFSDDGKLPDFFSLRRKESESFWGLFRSDRSSSKRDLLDTAALKENEIFVDQVTANRLGIRVHDTVYVDIGGASAKMTVAGVFENYIGSYVILHPKAYEAYFDTGGTGFLINTLWIKGADDDRTLARDLLEMSMFTGVQEYTSQKEQIDRSLECLDYMVVLIGFFAGALAFVVIYNLTVIHMAERTREIATVRVLGFYNKEVRAYILRENIYTAMTGAMLGLPVGVLVHRYVMSRLVIDTLSFPVHISRISFVTAWVCTLVFAILTNALMAGRMVRIPMAESLKAVE